MTPKVPRWLVVCYILAVVAGWGWLGDADYRDQRQDECAAKGKDYDRPADICINQVRSK